MLRKRMTHLINYLLNDEAVYRTAPATPGLLITLPVIKKCQHFFRNSKYWRASKSLNWFKSYGKFAEWLDFAYWWSCTGKCLRLQPAKQACSIWKCISKLVLCNSILKKVSNMKVHIFSSPSPPHRRPPPLGILLVIHVFMNLNKSRKLYL